MIFNYIAVFALLGLTTQADWENGTWTPSTSCEIATQLANANATGSTSFPGTVFDNTTGIISSTTFSNWSLIVSLTEITTSSASKEGLINFWLDTSATVPATIGTNRTTFPYNACAIELIGAPQQGDVCLSQNCVDALTRQFQSSASQIAEQMRQNNSAYMDEGEVCADMLTIFAPDECRDDAPYVDSDSQTWQAALSGAPYLDSRSAVNCTPSIPTIPNGLGGTSYLQDSVDNYTLYDLAVSRSTPFVIALWSNSTSMTALGLPDADEPWAEAWVGCVRPDRIRAGAREPATASGVKNSPWNQSAAWLAAALVFMTVSLV